MQTRHTGSHVTHSASGLFMHIRQHSTVPALVFHINQDNWAAPLGLSLSFKLTEMSCNITAPAWCGPAPWNCPAELRMGGPLITTEPAVFCSADGTTEQVRCYRCSVHTGHTEGSR